MVYMKIKIEKVKCSNPKCNHEWIPRQEVISGCPKCKYGYYKARVKKRKGSES
jgi:Zn finger protein HypA/HybF involved in hydrogenase expression